MVDPLQEDLFSILARFRTFLIDLTADVSKMYRQELINPTQTVLQRILWRDSVDELIKTFELVTYTSAASFLAISDLWGNYQDYLSQYPVASKIVLRDFYVDDLVTEANIEEEAISIKKEITQLLHEGEFELRKWASNASSLQGKQSMIE